MLLNICKTNQSTTPHLRWRVLMKWVRKMTYKSKGLKFCKYHELDVLFVFYFISKPQNRFEINKKDNFWIDWPLLHIQWQGLKNLKMTPRWCQHRWINVPSVASTAGYHDSPICCFNWSPNNWLPIACDIWESHNSPVHACTMKHQSK